MKNLLELKQYTAFLISRAKFDEHGYSTDEEITVGEVSGVCHVGKCTAFTPAGAYEILRQDIEFDMHGYIDTAEEARVYMTAPTKVDGYQNTYLVVASIKKKSKPEERFVGEYIIVEGTDLIDED